MIYNDSKTCAENTEHLMNYFYINSFGIQLTNFSPVAYNGSIISTSLTVQNVLDFLISSKKHIEPVFTQLYMWNRIYFFEKPGQKNISNFIDVSGLHVAFGTTKPTFKMLSDYIKSKYPEYKDYKIESCCQNCSIDQMHYIEMLLPEQQKIYLKANADMIVINPDNFEQVYPKLPEHKGKISPIFEKFLNPVKMCAVTPAQQAAFLQNCRML